ncbi:ABC transporter substrate-binding protein [Neobacillus sp. D3-1R]|uniref:ABC transporter substrate-binding protein n=1 Tax=Neobacillus sp. D3-1R TaxID=3445778 RepID=UPI003FA09682
MKKSFKQVISFMAILSLLLLAACSGGASQTSSDGKSAAGKSKDTLFLGMVNPPILFNPINSSDVASGFVEKFMFESLLEMDGPLNFVPKLADSFETTDNQTYTIKLNQKANWSDGKPVTAEDFAFTVNLVANPKVETTVGGYISTLEGLDANGKLPEGTTELSSVKVMDEKTIELKTSKPVDPNMLKEQLGVKFMILPKHVLKDVDPTKLSQHPFFQKPTVTNGAYKFVQYKKDQFVELEGNDNYYFGKPETKKIFIKIMPAPNLVAQLQTGELDMNVGIGIGKIAVQDYETVEKMKNIRTKVEPTIGFQTMEFNTKTIKDPKVRQAIAYALDRNVLVDKLLKGYGEVVDGPYTSLNPYLNKDMEHYKYDPEKAKKLLEEAGWDFNKKLRLVVPIGNKIREQSAPIIAQQLQQIGVKVEVTTYDFPTLLQKGKAGDFDLLLIGFTFTLDPDVSSLYGSNAPYNFSGYSNAKSDELLSAGKTEPNQDNRKQIYSDLQEIWNEDMPILTLYSDHDFDGINKEVKYGEPKVFGFHHNIHKWGYGAQ